MIYFQVEDLESPIEVQRSSKSYSFWGFVSPGAAAVLGGGRFLFFDLQHCPSCRCLLVC